MEAIVSEVLFGKGWASSGVIAHDTLCGNGYLSVFQPRYLERIGQVLSFQVATPTYKNDNAVVNDDDLNLA